MQVRKSYGLDHEAITVLAEKEPADSSMGQYVHSDPEQIQPSVSAQVMRVCRCASLLA